MSKQDPVLIGSSGLGMAMPAAVTASIIGILWLWFVGTTKLHEMLVGVGVVLAATLFIVNVLRSERLPLELRLVDLVQLWRIPWYIVSGIYEIALILIKDLVGNRAGSYYRYCGFRTSKRDPVKIAQTFLATAYTTTAPNFIVIGIDPEQNHMLFHQLERSTIPKMTRNLGAQR